MPVYRADVWEGVLFEESGFSVREPADGDAPAEAVPGSSIVYAEDGLTCEVTVPEGATVPSTWTLIGE